LKVSGCFAIFPKLQTNPLTLKQTEHKLPDIPIFWKLWFPCGGKSTAGDAVNSSWKPWAFMNPSNRKPIEWWGISIVSPLMYVVITDLSATRALNSCIGIFSNTWGSKSLAITIALSWNTTQEKERGIKLQVKINNHTQHTSSHFTLFQSRRTL